MVTFLTLTYMCFYQIFYNIIKLFSLSITFSLKIKSNKIAQKHRECVRFPIKGREFPSYILKPLLINVDQFSLENDQIDPLFFQSCVVLQNLNSCFSARGAIGRKAFNPNTQSLHQVLDQNIVVV